MLCYVLEPSLQIGNVCHIKIFSQNISAQNEILFHNWEEMQNDFQWN